MKLTGINSENTDLLDFQQVKDYLSFIAPVPYQSSFYYRTEIYKHATDLDFQIDEYTITLNGEQIFKKYATTLKDKTGQKRYDDIFGVHFKDFHDSDGALIAWMWIGLHKFIKAIPKVNQMRGLRLRKENIQIGGEDSLQKLFKEDRGNSYFVGEVFAVDSFLIPNSQRDYFNENTTRVEFERELRKYFNEELKKIYQDGSAINSGFKKIETYEKKEAEFKKKDRTGKFVDTEHREHELQGVLESEKQAEASKANIEKLKNKADNLMQKVIQRIEVEQPETNTKTVISSINDTLPGETKPTRRTDKLAHYSRNDRKLISKIFSIILIATDNETAERIISKIEAEL